MGIGNMLAAHAEYPKDIFTSLASFNIRILLFNLLYLSIWQMYIFNVNFNKYPRIFTLFLSVIFVE